MGSMVNQKHPVEQFRSIVGAENVLTEPSAMGPYLVDWRGRYHGRSQCVVRPSSTQELAAVVRLCDQSGVAMVPQGGNTSHCGGGIPDTSGDAVVISMERMNKVRHVDVENNTMTVEAGCILQTIQEIAGRSGRLFPLSLAAEGSCQIGGNLATNAGGVQVLRYGNARDLVLGLEVVLANGEVWNGLRALRKDNTGYDLRHLFIGSEGTLGIITAAVLKLFPLPEYACTAWFSVASPQAAVAVLGRLQTRFGAALTACELISDVSLGLVLKHIPGTKSPLSQSPWYVLVELTGSGSEGKARADLNHFLEPLLEHGEITDAVVAQSLEQEKRLWFLRESISEAQKKEGVSIKHDVSVPVSRIAEFLECAGDALEREYPGIRIVAFGHIGDGNLHYNQSRAEAGENEGFLAAQPIVNRIVHDTAHKLGGSISAEHGIGQLKRAELLRYKSPVEMALMYAIKKALDPKGLMNPGKVL